MKGQKVAVSDCFHWLHGLVNSAQLPESKPTDGCGKDDILERNNYMFSLVMFTDGYGEKEIYTFFY